MSTKPVSIRVNDASVSGLWQKPRVAKAALVLAHGAGAGMAHPWMSAAADGLGERGIATLRFNFPYMERGSKRRDGPALAQAAVLAATAEAARLGPGLPLFAGGKSYGGRMTSRAQSTEPLPGVRGLVFFGFPLHPAGAPGSERAKPLDEVKVPMLFLQGTNDALADLKLLRKVVAGLGPHATLTLSEHADHNFHVPAKSGGNDMAVMAAVLDAARDWMIAHAA
jgi:hypothetical protein